MILVLSGSSAWAYAAAAPADFPQGREIVVQRGAPLRVIAEDFEERGLIRSSFFFEGFVRLIGHDTELRAGRYFFERDLSVLDVVKRLTRGIFGLDPLRITIPEGATVREMASLYQQNLPAFPSKRFEELAEKKEGYLFPDTYFFLPDTPPEQIVAEMSANFRRRIAPYEAGVASSSFSMHEIVTLASLLEKEARKPKERRIISGIVRNRLERNMPLQLDATFRYILGKGSFQLTKKDLRHDSPYNTYINKGLPPGPIANPGLDSIVAALTPEKTKYLYYLHDMRGQIRYARTFAEHKRNKFAYLP